MLKAIMSIVLTVILSLLFSFFVCAEMTITFEGDGTKESPYLITTAEDMYEFASVVNNGYSFKDEYVKLTEDILLFDIRVSTAEIKTTWIPVGISFSRPFMGSFDGDGHEICGVYIYADTGMQGLFGYVSGGEIKNLTLSESIISGNGHYVGGIAAIVLSSDEGNHNDGLIKNCVNNANVSNGDMHTGGVAATATMVVDCVNNGDVVSESSWVGGVVNHACRIENCINNGSVIAKSDIAGVCYTAYCEQSHNYKTGVFGCVNNGYVKGDSECFGVTSVSYSKMYDCVNNGTVDSADSPSFMVGDMNGDKQITAADARKILRCAAKLEDDWDIYDTVICGDFDKDGNLTAADARKCLRYSAGIDDYYVDFGVNIK